MDPIQPVFAGLRTAVGLFDEATLSIPPERPRTQEGPPPGYSRTTVTTTVARQSATLVRAIELTRLAEANITFFAERQLITGSVQKSMQEALRTVRAGVRTNRAALARLLRQHADLLQAELATTRKERNAWVSSLKRDDDLESAARLSAQINLARLRQRRLELLLKDNRRTQLELEQLVRGGR
jgi:hypothetical protein